MKTPYEYAAKQGITFYKAQGNFAPGSYSIERSPEGKIFITARDIQGWNNGAADISEDIYLGLPVDIGYFSPPYPYRMLHLDCGRKYFSREDIEYLLTLMSWCRLNILNLHISERHAFRMQSNTHPEIVAPDHLSHEDIAALIRKAKSMGIRIIPSFDMPGHLDAVLSAHPWASLDPSGKNTALAGALDIRNPQACELIWEILDEVIEVFDTSEVTIGGDEFLEYGTEVDFLRSWAQEKYGPEAQENDAWVAFLNHTIERLAAQGIKTAVWNDGIYQQRLIDIDPRAHIYYWTRWGEHMESPTYFAQKNYSMVNWDGDLLYYVLRENQLDKNPTFSSVYSSFNPVLFPDKPKNFRIENSQGACFSIWCDDPDAQTVSEIKNFIIPPLHAFGLKLWPKGRRKDEQEAHKASGLLYSVIKNS